MNCGKLPIGKFPIYVKVGGTRPYFDTALAVKSGADVVVLDGMQGGTAATQDVFIENVGLPTLACIRPAVAALQELDMHRKVQLVVSGGIRTGADVAKALALGADAVAIGTAALIALGDNDPKWEKEYQKLGTTTGAYDDWHEGQDPAGITTQDPKLAARLDPVEGGRRLKNYLNVLTLEAQTIARACGHNHLQNLEPEDLCALTMEAAAMTQIPLAGTNWYPGKNRILTCNKFSNKIHKCINNKFLIKEENSKWQLAWQNLEKNVISNTSWYHSRTYLVHNVLNWSHYQQLKKCKLTELALLDLQLG